MDSVLRCIAHWSKCRVEMFVWSAGNLAVAVSGMSVRD